MNQYIVDLKNLSQKQAKHNNNFAVGDIIQHKDSDNNNPYYYIVLNRFNKYQYEYYNLFCFVLGEQVTLRMDNSKHYRVVSSVL